VIGLVVVLVIGVDDLRPRERRKAIDGLAALEHAREEVLAARSLEAVSGEAVAAPLEAEIKKAMKLLEEGT